MLPIAYFGIESSGLNLAVDLLILFVVVLYFSLIYWTYADARRRILDPMLVGCATAASCFPFVGTIIYMILRPPEYLEDVRERELETQAAEARLHQLDQSLCPHCDYRVENDFVRCPSCLRKLKERCANCSRPLDQTWTICPYCEADVPGISAPRSRRRRRAAAVLESEPAEAGGSSAAGVDVADDGEAAPAVAAELPARSRGKGRSGLADGAETPPAVAAESPTRPRGTGRLSRPGGRARPTS